MGIEIIVFVSAIIFGIFLYWRESNGNKLYRFVNKIANSKELQMSADNPKGFIFKQPFIPRLIFIVTLTLVASLIIEFLTPISIFGGYNGISAFFTFIVGTIIGNYLATFVIKSSKIIEEKSDVASDIFENVVEKGKDLIEDLKSDKDENVETEKKITESKPVEEKKSARESLKDNGLM
mgnify:CR=1 FL=1